MRDQMRHKSFYVLLGLSILFILTIRGCYDSGYTVNGKMVDTAMVAWHVSKIAFHLITVGMFLMVSMLSMKIFSRDQGGWQHRFVSFPVCFKMAIYSRPGHRHLGSLPCLHVYPSLDDLFNGMGKNGNHHFGILDRIFGMFDQPPFCDYMCLLFISFYAGFYQCAFYHGNSVRWFYFRWWLSDYQ